MSEKMFECEEDHTGRGRLTVCLKRHALPMSGQASRGGGQNDEPFRRAVFSAAYNAASSRLCSGGRRCIIAIFARCLTGASTDNAASSRQCARSGRHADQPIPFCDGPIPTTDSPATDVRAPLYSLWDQGDEFLLLVEIPGADPHKIDLELNVTQLTIHASLSERFKHRRLGSYRGSLNLPESVEPDHTTADYVEGLLEVILPKTRSLRKHKVKISYGDVGQERSPTEKSE